MQAAAAGDSGSDSDSESAGEAAARDSDSESDRGRSAGPGHGLGRRRHGPDVTVLNAAADDIPDTLIMISIKVRSLFWQQILTIYIQY